MLFVFKRRAPANVLGKSVLTNVAPAAISWAAVAASSLTEGETEAEAFAEAVEWCECNPDMNVSPKAATILNERCLKFASRPPPSDWQFTSMKKYKEMKYAE